MNLWYLLELLLLILEPRAAEMYRRSENICGNYNGRRIFIHLNEEGYVVARNITPPKNYIPEVSHSSYLDCTIQLVTCPSCIVNLEFKHLDLMPSCSNSPILQQIHDKRNHVCNCDVIRISESQQSSGYSSSPESNSFVPYCGFYTSKIFVQPRYKSETRSVSIKFLYSHSHHHAFTVKYSVTKNIRLFEGMVGGGGSILSPFFPIQYPRDLAMEYIIRCGGLNAATNCKIRLVFSDFNLASSSVIEVLDHHKHLLDGSTGAQFRPSILISRGSLLIVRFMANGGTGIGFKADYSFIPANYDERQLNPYTDCGGLVENTGGAITMMNMPEQFYDCVWIVQPLHKMYYLKTHLYVRIASAKGLGNNSELQIRQGVTSDRPLLESLLFPAADSPRPRREHIVPLPGGFYISLRASFTAGSALEIAYTTFSFLDEYHVSFPTQARDCYTSNDFLCINQRCIPGHVHCDGFDHCGDNSDEAGTCHSDIESSFYEKSWYSHKPNYYFPKLSAYPDFTSATLMFFLASVGLMIVIFTLIGILYKMGSRARQQRELHDRLHSISQFLVSAISLPAEATTRPSTPPAHDEPPGYEAPPDYAEALKCEALRGSSAVGSCRKPRRRRKRSSLRSRSSPGNFFPIPPGSTTVLFSQGNAPSLSSLNLTAPPGLDLAISPFRSPTPGPETGAIPDSPPPPYAYGNSAYYVYNNIIINVENADTADSIRHVTTTLSPPSNISPPSSISPPRNLSLTPSMAFPSNMAATQSNMMPPSSSSMSLPVHPSPTTSMSSLSNILVAAPPSKIALQPSSDIPTGILNSLPQSSAVNCPCDIAHGNVTGETEADLDDLIIHSNRMSSHNTYGRMTNPENLGQDMQQRSCESLVQRGSSLDNVANVIQQFPDRFESRMLRSVERHGQGLLCEQVVSSDGAVGQNIYGQSNSGLEENGDETKLHAPIGKSPSEIAHNIYDVNNDIDGGTEVDNRVNAQELTPDTSSNRENVRGAGHFSNISNTHRNIQSTIVDIEAKFELPCSSTNIINQQNNDNPHTNHRNNIESRDDDYNEKSHVCIHDNRELPIDRNDKYYVGDEEEKCVSNVIHHVKKINLKISESLRDTKPFRGTVSKRNSYHMDMRSDRNKSSKEKERGHEENKVVIESGINEIARDCENIPNFRRLDINQESSSAQESNRQNGLPKNRKKREKFNIENIHHEAQVDDQEQTTTEDTKKTDTNVTLPNSEVLMDHLQTELEVTESASSQLMADGVLNNKRDAPYGNITTQERDPGNKSDMYSKDRTTQNIVPNDMDSIISFTSPNHSLLTPFTEPSSLSSTDLSIHTVQSSATVESCEFLSIRRSYRYLRKSTKNLSYFSYPKQNQNTSPRGCHVFSRSWKNCSTQVECRTIGNIETRQMDFKKRFQMNETLTFCIHSHPNVYAMDLFLTRNI